MKRKGPVILTSVEFKLSVFADLEAFASVNARPTARNGDERTLALNNVLGMASRLCLL